MIIEDQRSILHQLAHGELSTEEAERRLAALDEAEDTARDAPADPPPPDRTLTDPEPPTQEVPVLAPESGRPRAAVRANLSGPGLIEVVGDEEATRAWVDGPATATVTDAGDGVAEVVGDLGDDAALIVPAGADLDLDLSGAGASVHGLRGTIQARLNVGDVRLRGVLSRGQSRIEANCGVLDIELGPGSDVVVSQRCAAAIDVDGGFTKTGRGQWRLGAGTASLEIAGSLGSISLRSR